MVVCALLSSFQLYRITFQELSQVIKLHKEGREKEISQPGHDPESKEEAGKQNKKSKPARLYKFSDENTVKGIFNKLTIVMISCVLFPVLVQNVYNLFFTNPGRQLFWEDCESMCITGYLLVMMAFDSYKKTKKIELLGLKRPAS